MAPPLQLVRVDPTVARQYLKVLQAERKAPASQLADLEKQIAIHERLGTKIPIPTEWAAIAASAQQIKDAGGASGISTFKSGTEPRNRISLGEPDLKGHSLGAYVAALNNNAPPLAADAGARGESPVDPREFGNRRAIFADMMAVFKNPVLNNPVPEEREAFSSFPLSTVKGGAQGTLAALKIELESPDNPVFAMTRENPSRQVEVVSANDQAIVYKSAGVVESVTPDQFYAKMDALLLKNFVRK